MRPLPILLAGAGMVLWSGCATHTTRSTLATRPDQVPRGRAEAVCRTLGYEWMSGPPVETDAAERNARRAWQWWPGSSWWAASTSFRGGGRAAAFSSLRARQRFWIRTRPDGGWDQIAFGMFASSSGGGCWSGNCEPASYWSRWVVHAGTFGPDGKERWPSAEVRADADSLLAVIEEASRHPARAASRGP
jgi:hypothetical protein